MKLTRIVPVLGLVAVAAIAACERDAPSEPESAALSGTDSRDSGGPGGPGGGGRPPRDSVPGGGGGGRPVDTLPPPYNGPVDLTVVVQSFIYTDAATRDTAGIEPVANAEVVVVPARADGPAVTARTDASGRVTFDLVTGTYDLKITPPAGSGLNSFAGAISLVQPSVDFHVTLFPPRSP